MESGHDAPFKLSTLVEFNKFKHKKTGKDTQCICLWDAAVLYYIFVVHVHKKQQNIIRSICCVSVNPAHVWMTTEDLHEGPTTTIPLSHSLPSSPAHQMTVHTAWECSAGPKNCRSPYVMFFEFVDALMLSGGTDVLADRADSSE